MCDQFLGNIPKVEEKMLYADFWIENSFTSSRLISSLNEIEKFNNRCIDKGIIKNIFNIRNHLFKDELTELILSISSTPTQTLYKDNIKLDYNYFVNINKNLNLEKIRTINTVKFGMFVRRTNMKVFPTDDRVFKGLEEYSLDRFMETAINLCEPCAILHESLDGQWYFVRIYNAMGWVRKKYVAIGKKDDIYNYTKYKDFLIVTGKRIYTLYNPLNKNISLVPIDMGVKLPLVRNEEILKNVYDMDPTTAYVVWFPIKNKSGMLEFTQILIPRNEDVNVGFLYYTEENILKQAFKFLGERYGWGGEFFGRDCSSFVLDVFKTMGIYIPRNTKEQENINFGMVNVIEKNTFEEKKFILDNVLPGSVLYLEGHVVIYLGKYNNEYYIIHDTIGFYISRICNEAKGDLKYIKANGVTLSPLTITYTSNGENYIGAIRTIKTFI